MVVIAIIGILAALLLPVLSNAKASARRIQCTSNLHQVGISLGVYVDDLKRYPPFVFSAGLPYRSNYWDAQLLPYAGGSKGVFLCPAQTGRFAGASNNCNYQLISIYGTFGTKQSYGFNTYGIRLTPSSLLAVLCLSRSTS